MDITGPPRRGGPRQAEGGGGVILCEDLRKRYGQELVLDGFSHAFGDTGFYLLYGESGSGKTTLLNLLTGMVPFEGGAVTVNGRRFETLVDPGAAGLDFDYITQDAFFADFLTLADNLRLVDEDEEAVRAVLSRVGLEGMTEAYPPGLSGGERQRLAFARSLLAGKRVLFLDEPTAALDEENKRLVFAALRELKKDALILCATHDAAAMEYADEIVAFQKCTGTALAPPASAPAKAPRRPAAPAGRRAGLGKYLKKWFASGRRTRGAERKFFLFLTLAALLLLLGDLPGRKKDMTLENCYRANAVKYWDFSQDVSVYDALRALPGVRAVVLSYAQSCPAPSVTDPDTGMVISPEYETSLNTLPADEALFRLSHRIEYGRYCAGEREVLLSWEAAEALSPGDHAALVGRTFTKKLYALGDVEFEIAGVLGRLNKFERGWFLSMDMPWDSVYYSGRLTQRFIGDESFFAGEQRIYYLYFDSWRDLSAFADAYGEELRLNVGGRAFLGRDGDMISLLAVVLMPLAALVALFAALFYTNLVKTEITLNSRFVAAFEYAGYSRRRVLSRFTALHMRRLLVMSALALGIALALSEGFNALNRRFVFLGYQLFTANPWLILLFFGAVAGLSYLSIAVSLRRLKVQSWYETAVLQRDLI